MRERPILFSGPMVAAILDGRKTQTRRVVKPQPQAGDFVYDPAIGLRLKGGPNIKSPYGLPGDRLWVRETWGIYQRGDSTPGGRPIDPAYVYRANDENYRPDIPDYAVIEPFRWRPSIHMPRRACRIVLEVTGVCVERLLDCSPADALAEGATPEMPFGTIWKRINTAPGIRWEDNPCVWVIEFRRISDAGQAGK